MLTQSSFSYNRWKRKVSLLNMFFALLNFSPFSSCMYAWSHFNHNVKLSFVTNHQVRRQQVGTCILKGYVINLFLRIINDVALFFDLDRFNCKGSKHEKHQFDIRITWMHAFLQLRCLVSYIISLLAFPCINVLLRFGIFMYLRLKQLCKWLFH